MVSWCAMMFFLEQKGPTPEKQLNKSEKKTKTPSLLRSPVATCVFLHRCIRHFVMSAADCLWKPVPWSHLSPFQCSTHCSWTNLEVEVWGSEESRWLLCSVHFSSCSALSCGLPLHGPVDVIAFNPFNIVALPLTAEWGRRKELCHEIEWFGWMSEHFWPHAVCISTCISTCLWVSYGKIRIVNICK